MQEPQREPATGPKAAPGPGRGTALETEPLDRSYLLRKETPYPFPSLIPAPDAIRFRRSRRVGGSFRAIPPLSRNGRP